MLNLGEYSWEFILFTSYAKVVLELSKYLRFAKETEKMGKYIPNFISKSVGRH